MTAARPAGTRPAGPPPAGGRGSRLAVDMIACDGRGVCAEVLPEIIELDDWGFPMLAPGPVPEHLQGQAREAIRLCPRLALRLER